MILSFLFLLSNGKINALYLRARAKPSNDEWYCDVRVGINNMLKVVENLCAKAGLDGHFTNHSLRATAASKMYCAELPEAYLREDRLSLRGSPRI